MLISDDYYGRADDELPPNLDRIGVINTNDEPLPIYLERTEDPDGAPLWLFSSETLQALPAITDTDSALAVDRYLPDFLLTNKWGNVPIGHWLVILLFMGLAYLLAWGLVALGVIALALGAQKTVENLVGGVTLIADQPLRVGDFCKIEGQVGTVEQIGMCSIRIRTLDCTVVFIPNGQLAAGLR